ncbi:hypothetical protein ACP4OV_014904 [Aristida adscensionis]
MTGAAAAAAAAAVAAALAGSASSWRTTLSRTPQVEHFAVGFHSQEEDLAIPFPLPNTADFGGLISDSRMKTLRPVGISSAL